MTSEKRMECPRSNWIATLAATVIVLAGVKLAASLVVPLLLAAFLSLICLPPLYWLRKKGIPDAVAVTLIVVTLIGLGLVLVATVGTSFGHFKEALPTYKESLTRQTAALFAWLSAEGVDIGSYETSLKNVINPGSAMQFAGEALRGAGGALSSIFMLVMTVAFILFEVTGMPAKLAKVSSDPKWTILGFEKFMGSLKRYLGIKTLVSLLTGLFVSIWLIVVGVDFPILWGALAFALNYVPTIGSVIAAIPPTLLALVQLGPGAALSTGVGYLIANVLMGNVIEPRLTGKGLGLSTLVVFLSLVVWGWFLGPVGMLLSVPLTMVVKIALESRPDTQHLAVLLGSGIEESKIKEESIAP